jgi:hypothetical protein
VWIEGANVKAAREEIGSPSRAYGAGADHGNSLDVGHFSSL